MKRIVRPIRSLWVTSRSRSYFSSRKSKLKALFMLRPLISGKRPLPKQSNSSVIIRNVTRTEHYNRFKFQTNILTQRKCESGRKSSRNISKNPCYWTHLLHVNERILTKWVEDLIGFPGVIIWFSLEATKKTRKTRKQFFVHQ